MKKLNAALAILILAALLLPTATMAQTPPECESEYTVQKDDWLSKIADKYYGDILAYMVIVEATAAQTDDQFSDIENADLIEPGWLLCIPAHGDMAAAPEGLSPQELANATYQGIYEQPVTLTDGAYAGEPFVEGGASRPTVTLIESPIAYGDINGDGQDDAAVLLAENSGGSGTFVYLAAVANQDGQPVNVATTLLGDRVQVESLKIENNQIVVEMVQAGPDDPMCCPSQQVVKTYELQGDQLVETSSQVVGAEAEASTDIVGIVWNWQGFQDTAEKNDIVVPNPDNYRLELLPDGTFAANADCNLVSGSYTLAGSSLSLQPGPTTLAECGPTSLYNEYTALLGQVVTYVRDGDNMYLNLIADAGNMKFGKLQAVTGRVVAQEPAPLPEKAQIEVQVMDVSLADAPATQVGGQTIFDVAQFPIDYEATYNAQAIDPRHTYGLNVRITDAQGNLLYINAQSYPVITQGNPTYHVEVHVEVMVDIN
jgi:uncharacterized lipoprotein YbaY/heat shock protein HslJ